jgi:hypothetical protein
MRSHRNLIECFSSLVAFNRLQSAASDCFPGYTSIRCLEMILGSSWMLSFYQSSFRCSAYFA